MRHSMKLTPALVLAALPAASALAQESASAYPSKPVRVIVAQAAGGGADTVARVFASKVSESLGRQFVIENHPGRDLAWTMVARAKPDGYTLMPILPDFTFAPALFSNLPVDPAKDYAPISLMTRTPYLLVVNSAFPAKNIKEFVAYAKAQPGKLNFSGGLPGTGTHLIAIWFLSQANAKATYVPYKGVSQAVVDLLAGRVDATFATGSATAHLKSGKLRALGVSTAQRARTIPDLPTIQEQGVPFDASAFHGWGATAGTPAPIIDKLAAELAKAARSPDVMKTLAADNADTVGSTPEEFRKFIAAEIPRWVKVVKDSGIKVEGAH
jgi:tripartite-type tricarboxylate transporter receptor subunit TctC